MEANARNLERIFDSTVSYQIPLFQRPYVWDKEKNWEPLWEDILSLLERKLSHGRTRSHFLGAVVLEQLKNASGSIESRQVIDGQQRFTTLQVFMVAVRDICQQLGSDKFFDRFNDLVANKESKVDNKHEEYKVWPTNSDRAAFALMHRAGSSDRLWTLEQESEGISHQSVQILQAYHYFYNKVQQWFDGLFDEDDAPEATQDDRLDAIWHVVRSALQLVVIDLDNDDESQVIFETLNARGTQLLPADLIKNFLFHRAQLETDDLETLYESYWREFDNEFWRTEIKQGRIKRPRIDLFIQHYLTLATCDDVRTTHLFEVFKSYVSDQEEFAEEGSDQTTSLIPQPDSIQGHLQALTRYAKAFKSFAEPAEGTRLALFIRRLQAIDTATVYPLLLLASDALLPDQQQEFDDILLVLESFLMRRMICHLGTKNYNRLFLEAIRTLNKNGEITATALTDFLQISQAESSRFPDDLEFENAIQQNPLYHWLPQYKVRAVLEALDQASEHSKSEPMPLPDGLTIEHILPRGWQEFWPVPEEIAADSEEKLSFTQKRNQMMNTLGNLTLITGSLNPSLSNANWETKHPELIKFSKLNLNRYFHDVSVWDEDAITLRSTKLFEIARQIWPYLTKEEV